MSFRQFREQVNSCILEALKSGRFSRVDFQLTEPPRLEFGDLSSNTAFVLARKVDQDINKVAKKIASNISLRNRRLVQSFKVQNGYINFRVNLPDLAYLTLSRATRRRNYGAINVGKGRRYIVEHTSVNPNKALHYGHFRNVVLGDSLQRILKFAGYDVTVLNYIDDSGAQVADLIIGFRYAGFPSEPPEGKKYDHYCGDTVYVRVNALYESRPDLVTKQKEVLKGLEDPSSEIARLAREVTRRILKEQLSTCWRIGARYDCLNFESHIIQSSLWRSIFEKMKKKRIAHLQKGGRFDRCWIVTVKGEEEGEEKVLVRSDGTATYVAKDVPYAAWKIGLVTDKFGYQKFTGQPDGTVVWATSMNGKAKSHPAFAGADFAITITDVRQKRLQRIISHILSRLSGNPSADRYVHLAYEPVSLSADTARAIGVEVGNEEFLHMAGRKGIYVNADDVLDAVHRKAYQETKARNPEESKEWLMAIAEKVAVSAVRFELLKQDVDKMITFDLTESLKLEGETGPYIQYAHARASRILEKAGFEPRVTRTSASHLTDPLENDLLKRISKFDLFVEDAAKNLSPRTIARYSYTLATSFNTFYEKKPVIQEADEDTRMGRLALVKAFQNTCRIALELLGIEAPPRI